MLKRFFLILALLIGLCAPANALQKNVASQKWIVFAFDITDNTAKTGDAAQITGSVYIDGSVNAIDDTNPTELGGGYYAFDLAQAETNGDNIVIVPASSTGSVQVVGVPGAVWTTIAQSGDAYARLGAPAGASVSADIAAVKSDTAAILTDTAAMDSATELRTLLFGSDTAGATAANQTTIIGYIDTEVAAILMDTAAMDTANEIRTLLTGGTSAVSILTATDNIGINWADVANPTATVNLSGTTVGVVTTLTTWDKTGYALSAAGIDAIWDEVQSGHATAGSFGIYLNAPVGTIDTVVDAIKAKTDNLPSDPADASVVAGLIATVQADLDNPAQYKADVSGLSTFNPATDEVDIGSVKGTAVTDIDDFKDGASTTVY